MQRFFDTDSSRVALFQRLVLALVVAAHGSQKLLGWFGGWGFEGTMHWFTVDMGVPAIVAFLIVAGETAGMLALAAGFVTRLAAAGVTLTMLGAIVLVHGRFGFFMNWAGNLGGEGYELHILALALALPLVVSGGGAASLDGLIARRLRVGARSLAAAEAAR